MHICPRAGHGISDVMTKNTLNSPEYIGAVHITTTTLAERFLGASVSVFKGCVTLWGGRWPMNIYILTYSWKPEVIRTLLPILFTLPGPPQFTKKERICFHIPCIYLYIRQLNQSSDHFCRHWSIERI